MTEAYDGRQVVGMDLHRRRSVLVRMTEDGRKLETVRIANSPAELRKVIARAGENPRVVVEATYGWYWAADVLEEAGAEVHLAHPLGVKAYTYRRVKNDERDAADLADLLRMGRLPEAWIAPPEIRELREITRYRMLCRHRHRVRYAESRIIGSPLDQGWVSGRLIAGFLVSSKPVMSDDQADSVSACAGSAGGVRGPVSMTCSLMWRSGGGSGSTWRGCWRRGSGTRR
jgi:hypothetical protein